MPGAPYVRPLYRPGDNSITQLIMEQGAQQADASRRSGALWGNAISGIGQQIGGALEARQAKKEEEQQKDALSKRDAAWIGYVQSGQWQNEPTEVRAANAMKVWGPQEGMKQLQGLESLSKIGQGKPEDDAKHFGYILGAAGAMDPSGRAKLWPEIKALNGKVFPGVQIGDDYNEEDWKLVAPLGAQLRGEKPAGAEKLGVHVVQGSLVDDTGKVLFTAQKEAPKGPSAGSEEAYVLQRFGPRPTADQVLQARRDWAAAGREPKAVQGNEEVTGFVDALRAGDIGLEAVPSKMKGAVLEAARAGGVDARTTKQKETDAGAESLLSSLGQIEEQARKTITASTGPGAKVDAIGQSLLNKVGLAPETKKWEGQIAKLSQFARQMGERGALTDKDIERVQALLPTLDDPVDIRDKKLKDVREIIEAGLRGKVSSRVKFSGSADPGKAGGASVSDPLGIR